MARTHEGIYHGVTHAQVGVVITGRAWVRIPGGRGRTVNAVRDEPIMLVQARRTLTTPIACRLHVCGNCTRILIESVICLDKSGS